MERGCVRRTSRSKVEFKPVIQSAAADASRTAALREIYPLLRGVQNQVGMARCAVRAAFSGATVPPAAAPVETSQRDVPTSLWQEAT
jgi:hypothetical protein